MFGLRDVLIKLYFSLVMACLINVGSDSTMEIMSSSCKIKYKLVSNCVLKIVKKIENTYTSGEEDRCDSSGNFLIKVVFDVSLFLFYTIIFGVFLSAFLVFLNYIRKRMYMVFVAFNKIIQ